MRWLESQALKAASGSPVLQSDPACPISFVTEEGRVLCRGAADSSVCVLGEADLRTPAAWHLMQKLYVLTPALIVSKAKQIAPEASPETLCAILNWRQDYQNLSDVKELASLDDCSIELGSLFDLPVSVLRLFARIEERENLLALIQKHAIRKNIVREIIQDLYDTQDRAAVIRAMQEFLEKNDARESQEELRDLVRAARYPRSQEIRSRIRSIMRTLQLPKGMQVETPQDLENGKTRIVLSLRKAEELKAFREKLSDRDFEEKLSEILSML